MKRFLMATAAVASVLVLSPSAVGAVPYGPSDPSISVDNPTVVPGGNVTITMFGFEPGEDVEVDVALQSSAAKAGSSYRTPGAVVGSVTANDEGVATAVVTAPQTPGTYLLTATGQSSGFVATATFTVVGSGPTSGGGSGGGSTGSGSGGGSLPATGSDNGWMLQTGALVLVLGAGLVGVAAMRRRNASI